MSIRTQTPKRAGETISRVEPSGMVKFGATLSLILALTAGAQQASGAPAYDDAETHEYTWASNPEVAEASAVAAASRSGVMSASAAATQSVIPVGFGPVGVGATQVELGRVVGQADATLAHRLEVTGGAQAIVSVSIESLDVQITSSEPRDGSQQPLAPYAYQGWRGAYATAAAQLFAGFETCGEEGCHPLGYAPVSQRIWLCRWNGCSPTGDTSLTLTTEGTAPSEATHVRVELRLTAAALRGDGTASTRIAGQVVSIEIPEG